MKIMLYGGIDMYDPKSKIWLDIGQKNYEFETAYYLKYNLEKAHYAIEKIYSKNINFQDYCNKCVYYHIYIDLLMEAIGQIRSRFNKGIKNKEYNDIRENNCKSYDFRKDNFPILYEKEFRNFVTHIDERNIDFILENKGVGGFNVIFEDTTESEKEAYLNFKLQNNTLDLVNKIYYIYSNKKNKMMNLKLDLLKEELKKLEEINNIIWSYITEE